MTMVHLHATVSDRGYCDTVCGLRCDEAFQTLDKQHESGNDE